MTAWLLSNMPYCLLFFFLNFLRYLSDEVSKYPIGEANVPKDENFKIRLLYGC